MKSVLVDYIMRTLAIIVVLGQSHCPHRLAAAPGKGELGHPQRSYTAPQARQGQATSQRERAGPVQGTGGRAQGLFVCGHDFALGKDSR